MQPLDGTPSPGLNAGDLQVNQTLTAENTALKKQILDLMRDNHLLATNIDELRADISVLQEQLQAERIAHDSQAEMFRQQLQIHQQNVA